MEKQGDSNGSVMGPSYGLTTIVCIYTLFTLPYPAHQDKNTEREWGHKHQYDPVRGSSTSLLYKKFWLWIPFKYISDISVHALQE